MTNPTGTMPDNRGLYDKFTVKRNDGTDAPGEKHSGCSYFVLDLTHDKAAPIILPALASTYETTGRPALAADLWQMAAGNPPVPTDPAVPAPGPDTPTWTIDDDSWFVYDGRRVAVALCYLEPEHETLPVAARDALKQDVRAARAHEHCGPAADTLRRAYKRWLTAVEADQTEDVLEARASAVFRAVAVLVDGGGDG